MRVVGVAALAIGVSTIVLTNIVASNVEIFLIFNIFKLPLKDLWSSPNWKIRAFLLKSPLFF